MNKILAEINNEYQEKLEQMKQDFGDRLDEFDNSDWTEQELMAYDLGFTKALSIALDIINEGGK